LNDPDIYWKADRRPAAEAPLDLAPLLGDWINTNADTRYFSSVCLREHDGTLIFQGFGSSDGPDPIDWGQVTARPYAGGAALQAGGFYARYDKQDTHLVANQKLGILVIQSYTGYADGSGRAPHFAREFFHR